MHRERVVMSCHAVVEYAKFEIDCIFFFFKTTKIIFPGFVPKLCLFLTPSPLIYVCAACVCLLACVAELLDRLESRLFVEFLSCVGKLLQ